MALTLVGAGCAVVLAACGGSGGGGTGTQAGYNGALRFAQCMRAHGVPNFPDPSAGGGGLSIGPGLNPQSPSFQGAQKACARYGPSGKGPPQMTEAQRVAAFKFAKCVRAHGYPGFPDPSLSAPHGAVAVLSLRGMLFAFSSLFDPRSPAFRAAASDCGLKLPPPGARGKVSLVPGP